MVGTIAGLMQSPQAGRAYPQMTQMSGPLPAAGGAGAARLHGDLRVEPGHLQPPPTQPLLAALIPIALAGLLVACR